MLADLAAKANRAADTGRPLACQIPTADGRSLWISDDPDDIAAAIDLCAGCPLTDLCREASLKEVAGVWAGLDRSRMDCHHGEAAELLLPSLPGRVCKKCRALEQRRAKHRRARARALAAMKATEATTGTTTEAPLSNEQKHARYMAAKRAKYLQRRAAKQTRKQQRRQQRQGVAA